MLVIRMQRTGRKGHAMFRVIVQDSRLTPTSGKVVAHLGSYDPHAKTITLDKEKAKFYLDHGAQPSDRVAGLLKQESVKLPDWVNLPVKKERTVRSADKRRSTAPAAPVEETPSEAPEERPIVPSEEVSASEEEQPAVPGDSEAAANQEESETAEKA